MCGTGYQKDTVVVTSGDPNHRTNFRHAKSGPKAKTEHSGQEKRSLLKPNHETKGDFWLNIICSLSSLGAFLHCVYITFFLELVGPLGRWTCRRQCAWWRWQDECPLFDLDESLNVFLKRRGVWA